MKAYFYRIYLLILLIGLIANPLFSNQNQYTDIIQHVKTVEASNGIEIFCDLSPSEEEASLYYIIKYISQQDFISKKVPEWKYSKPIPIVGERILLQNVDNNKPYLFSMAIINKSITEDSYHNIGNWSGLHIYKPDARWSINSGIVIHILVLLGALGLFIYGMKIMSDGIQKGTGRMLRKLIGGMTSNKANGIFYGFLTTSLVQSSSAITVMVVSFVNNGLLNLKQSIAVIIGANIGTTITLWIIAFFGFKAYMLDYALIIFLLSIILLFSDKNKLRAWGEMLAGIALLFFGFEFLKNGIPDVSNIEQFNFLNNISGTSLWSVILATIIGAIITILFQSSIAALALIILLSARGIIPYEMALGMVLGSNIGTTITANIAALVGNVHAKRAARAHLFFNLLGAIWMIFLFPYFIQLIDFVMMNGLNMHSPSVYYESRPIALAMFHTGFNLINSFIIFWLVDLIAKFITELVPTKSDEDEIIQLGYLKAGVLSTPELRILEAKKEIAKLGKITNKMSGFFQQLLIETDKKKKKYLYQKIERYEDITDRVEVELINYLTKTSEGDLSEETSKRVRSMMEISSYLERIGDVFYQMSLILQRKEEDKIWFSPSQRESIQEMLKLVDKAFIIMIQNLEKNIENVSLTEAFKIEHKINNFRDQLRSKHFENIEKQEYNIKSGMIYSDLFFSCEKIGDHIMNITESLVDEDIVQKPIDDVVPEKNN